MRQSDLAAISSSPDAEQEVCARFRYRQREFSIRGKSSADHLYRSIAKARGFYEIDLLEYMFDIASCFSARFSVAIDVGANIGNHSIYFAAFLTDHVISVEPNPDVLALLHANLTFNVSNFTVCPVALGEHQGRAELFMPDGAHDNVGMARICAGSGGAASAASSIEVKTLDSVVENWKREHNAESSVALLKIDVEGMELAVLRGAERLLRTDRPHVFAEAATRGHFEELRQHLAKFGYVALTRWATTPVYHFVYQPSASLRWRARALKVRSEFRRPVEIRRLARRTIAATLNAIRSSLQRSRRMW